ncbi:MAG: bifunctional methylenetetrahydrofolate dehydrogenase/methenyltetrahydrofolate cyclohydrolase [Candidatus Aminicenantes bacterium RBG_16_63_16]|nr:MAG: bifunctional methylenetetrahydrofolate dehydrogenase/methenyltetrahydrofolate cyclohydrolase [Candidatus Aminicenantes bacterium RBG_16_63_16]
MGSWLEGKALAEKIKQQVKDEVAVHQGTRHQVPGLIGILVGDNRSSQIYLRSKEKACQALGIASQILTYPGDLDPRSLKEEIEELNRRDDVDGILVQLPLPAHLDAHEIICAISPAKDVDGIHPFNLGNLLANQDGPKPCTPLGIIELLKSSGVPIAGQEAVVIGRSLIVGKPVAAMLTNENATVSVCHSKTRDLAATARRADILVAAMGKPAFVRPEFVKPGATIIDVGINRVSDRTWVKELFGDDEKRRQDLDEKGYTVVGDVDPRAFDRAGLMTPVPGGVGLLTVAMLMKNTLEAFKRRRGIS